MIAVRGFLFVVVLASGGAAWAGNAAQGELAFKQACHNCHTATQYQSGQAKPPKRSVKALPHMGPDLGVVLRASGVRYFKKWVKDPWAVQPKTACDPRLLHAEQVENLISFLSTKTRPEPARQKRVSATRRAP